jgi:hypothetical protein
MKVALYLTKSNMHLNCKNHGCWDTLLLVELDLLAQSAAWPGGVAMTLCRL